MLKHHKVIKEALESKLRELWVASDEERQPYLDALEDLNNCLSHKDLVEMSQDKFNELFLCHFENGAAYSLKQSLSKGALSSEEIKYLQGKFINEPK